MWPGPEDRTPAEILGRRVRGCGVLAGFGIFTVTGDGQDRTYVVIEVSCDSS